MNHSEILEMIYNEALQKAAIEDLTVVLPNGMQEQIKLLVSRSQSNKGMIAVLTTLLTHKIYSPQQDIRYHQAQLDNGFAGRGIDQAYVTPFMKTKKFPAMAESQEPWGKPQWADHHHTP